MQSVEGVDHVKGGPVRLLHGYKAYRPPHTSYAAGKGPGRLAEKRSPILIDGQEDEEKTPIEDRHMIPDESDLPVDLPPLHLHLMYM